MRKTVAFCLVAVLGLWASGAVAQTVTPVDVATISMTAGVPRTVTNTICATDGNDLVCDRGAYLLSGGLISTTNISATNISATRISGDGSQLTNLPSASASPTNVPAFLARMTSGQAIPDSTNTKINFNVEDFDTFNNFSSGRFTPTIPGKYILTGTAAVDGNIDTFLILYKNGATYAWGNRTGLASGPNQFNYSTFSVVADANGSSDYFEVFIYQRNSTNVTANLVADGTRNYFSGSLLASGNGLISGSTALGDRITSGTTAVLANGTGYVSLSTASSTWGYLGSTDSYLPKLSTAQVSATTISTTAVQIFSPTTALACSSNTAGTIRYNSPTTTLELCTGSGWQPMGVGIPAGTISAFASTTCPTGWSEYTAARGRFLRGIDNAAGNDPSGTRAPGATQADLLKNHSHGTGSSPGGFMTAAGNTGAGYGWAAVTGSGSWQFSNVATNTGTPTADAGAETRPKNVAVTFCQFNGTSNGWNNPLSGGSTVAAGSTGQLQYNTGNAFDASAGLTWTNASSLLGVDGTVSTTSLTVGGRTLEQYIASSSTASGDRITSGTTSVVVNGSTNTISFTIASTTTGYMDSFGLLVAPGISLTTANGISSSAVYTSRFGLGIAPSTTTPFQVAFENATAIGPVFSRHVDTGAGMIMFLRRSRGTAAAPTILQSGDIVGGLLMQGYDGSGYIGAAGIRTYVDGTPSTGIMPIGMALQVSNVNYLNIASNGNVGVGLGGNQSTPVLPSTSLHVSGTLRIGDGGEACDANRAGAIRYTSASTFQTCNGGGTWTAIGSGSGIASPTNVPAFRVYNSANQTVSANTWTKIQFNTEFFDTYNNFDSATNYRFQPTVAGKYIITMNVGCAAAPCYGAIMKNNAESLAQFSGGNNIGSAGSTIVDMNGTTDYVEGWGYVTGGTTITGASSAVTNMAGSLLASGNGLISSSTALGDRITSGTSAMVVNSATGIISMTQLGTATSYMHPSLGYVGPGVSTTGTVSTTDVKLSTAGGNCGVAGDYGRMFRNPTTGRIQFCMPR